MPYRTGFQKYEGDLLSFKLTIHWFHPSMQLLAVQCNNIKSGTKQMKLILLAIPCEKFGMRTLLNVLTERLRIWSSRVGQNKSKTVSPLFIGCNYTLHSLIPSHFWTYVKRKKTATLLMTMLIKPCSVSQPKLFIIRYQQSHSKRINLNQPQYFSIQFRTWSWDSCLQNYKIWEENVSCPLILEVFKFSIPPFFSFILTSEL